MANKGMQIVCNNNISMDNVKKNVSDPPFDEVI